MSEHRGVFGEVMKDALAFKARFGWMPTRIDVSPAVEAEIVQQELDEGKIAVPHYNYTPGTIGYAFGADWYLDRALAGRSWRLS